MKIILFITILIMSFGCKKGPSKSQFETRHEFPIIENFNSYVPQGVDLSNLKRETLLNSEHFIWDNEVEDKGYINAPQKEEFEEMLSGLKPLIKSEYDKSEFKEHIYKAYYEIKIGEKTYYPTEKIIISKGGDIYIGLRYANPILDRPQKNFKIKLGYDPLNGIFLANKTSLYSDLEQQIYARIWLEDIKYTGVVRVNNVRTDKIGTQVKRKVYMQRYDTSLQDLINNGYSRSMHPKNKMEIMALLLKGLKNLHGMKLKYDYPRNNLKNYEYKFFHSDIKPDNVFCITKKALYCVIGDFDLSALLDNMVGTLGFYAPEETELLKELRLYGSSNSYLNKLQQFESKQDVWSLGLTLAMLMMRKPSLDSSKRLPNFTFIEKSIKEVSYGKYDQVFDTGAPDYSEILTEIEIKKSQLLAQERQAGIDRAWDIIAKMLNPNYVSRISAQSAYEEMSSLLK